MRGVAWLAALMMWSAAAAQDRPLEAGLAEIDITPPVELVAAVRMGTSVDGSWVGHWTAYFTQASELFR